MTIIGFVRHGVTAWNKEGRAQGSSDIPLDEEGFEMAARVADRLADEQWDVIYSSQQLRAKQTAEVIAQKMGNVDVRIDPRLREVGGGKIEGTTEAERIEKWGEGWRQLDMGFEPAELILARGTECLTEIQQQHKGKRVLVVSHGSFIKRMVQALVPDPAYEKSLANTSLTVIELADDKNRCELFNCTKHLS